ncbi:cellulose synthase-like protein E1 [Vigna radiata var. radiata]|uniref:Cellulose synthase-like protein E1 n=1 Tax=Vigna radiata var. radiata TaxID=3916 RepID=A0A3Q0F028_VIGRR|nr:cellulose synthase-like protein E1 [Vigna radiata var. radiata]
MRSGEQHSLFETRKDRARHIRRFYAVSVFLAICFVWAFRLSHIPANGEAGQWAWLGLFLAELWSGIYWLFYQALRWNMLFRTTFPDKLSQRYESRLPGVDIFVFTADAAVEPPLMVINTVLSVMAYDYPAEKLSVYLSDDGCSEITFYALLEASSFAKHWVPFCKRFKVEPRSPAAFFNNTHASTKSQDHNYDLRSCANPNTSMKHSERITLTPERVRPASLEYESRAITTCNYWPIISQDSPTKRSQDSPTKRNCC